MQPPISGDNWIGVTQSDLPIAVAYDWSVRPGCGAVVLFSGVVRDHAVDDAGTMRDDVQHLTYEAYEEQAVVRFQAIADEVRTRWPTAGRVVLLHRLGRLEVGESSVVAIVSTPHRPEAFEAARYAIDALKASAPIWKHEVWGSEQPVAAWGTGAHDVVEPSLVPTVRGSE